MPLNHSGSKKAIGENIKTEMTEGNKPRRQAIAIALDVARRAEKAMGGAVGYAEGGEVSDAKMARAISDRAMRGLEPTPEQQKYLRHMQSFKEGNSERLGGLLPTVGKEAARALSPPIPGWSAQSFDDWNAQTKAKQDERQGMGEGERFRSTLGDFAGEALPYALPEIGAGAGALMKAFPKATGTLAGGLGMLGLPAEAGAGKEEVAARQKMLKDAGFYDGAIDGEEGPATRAAQAKFDQSAAVRDAREVEKLKAQAEIARAQSAGKETERKATEAETSEAKRKQGEERFQQAEKDLSPWNRMIRDYGPTAGYIAGAGLGMLGKAGVRGASDKLSANRATRANDLLKDLETKDVPSRVGAVNQFWSEGQPIPTMGSRKMPFEAAPGSDPAFKANASAPPSGDLYLPSRAKDIRNDLGVASGFAGESLYAQEKMAPEAKAELDAARAAFSTDPSESNLARLQSAMDKVATSDFLTNLGRAGAATYLGSGFKMQRNPTRPDIAKAEAERIRLDELLARGGPKPNPAGVGPPPGLPGLAQPGSATALRAPEMPQAPGAMPIPSGSAQTELAGTALPKEAAGVASSSPEVRYIPVPVRVFDSGRVKYAPGVPEELGVVPGRFAKGEHRPTKKEVAQKKAPSKSAAKTESAQPPKKLADPIDLDEIPVKPDVPFDDPSRLTRGMNRGGAIGRAMQVVARAMGGRVHTGPITEKADGGRTDTVPMHVAANSYVVPADIVSSLGQGDTNAGYRVLEHMFGPAETRAEGGAVPIIAAGGEFVLTPEQVAQIGAGNAKTGHEALDQWVKIQRRKHIQTLKGLPGPARD